MKKFNIPVIALTSLVLAFSSAAFADEAAVQAQLKDSKCTKCHSVDKKKAGPSFKETAAKYKGKADAEQKLYTHLTTGPTIKVDGEEEKHVIIKTKDDAAIKEVIGWILKQ
jgi:cytochrome c